MNYASICDGIGAVHEAWKELGWKCAFVSEIAPFPTAVVEHRWGFKNLGDFTKIGADAGPVDLVVAGTPCQDFSVAGLRAGVGGDRGNLTLEFLKLLLRLRPRWVVWENVPGVLSSTSHVAPDPCPTDESIVPPPPPLDMDCDGQEVETEDDRDCRDDEYDSEEVHAFNSFLAGLSECGYGWAYRVLDAQFAGVPQRRRRVFVVGYFGDWRRAAAVLLERESLSGNPSPSREAGQGVTGTLESRTSGGGGFGDDFNVAGGVQPVPYAPERTPVTAKTPTTTSLRGGCFETAPTLDAHYGEKQGLDNQHIDAGGGYSSVAKSLNSHGGRFDYETETFVTHARPLAFDCKASGQNGFGVGEIASTLRGMGAAESHQNGGGHQAICFDTTQITSKTNRSNPQPGDPCHPLCSGANAPSIAFNHNKSGNDGSSLGVSEEQTDCLRSDSKAPFSVHQPKMAVRRLTPRECERLMGQPDDATLIQVRSKPAADGPRYKALGNSMVVQELRWIGQRIALVDTIPKDRP